MPGQLSGIPENDYAVLMDTERHFICDAGRYSEMLNRADVFNQLYQSTAYRAIRWTDGRIY